MKKEYAAMAVRVTARELRELSKDKVYNLDELIPMAKKEMVQKRKFKNIAEASDGEAIMYLRDAGYKFVEKAVMP